MRRAEWQCWFALPAALLLCAGACRAAAAEATAAVKAPQWSGGFEFGLTGSEGNAPRMNFRVGAQAQHHTGGRVLSFDSSYSRATDRSELSEHKLLASAKHDWLFPGRPWVLFQLAGLEFDQFKDFDVRLNAALGPGYQFVHSESTALLGRLGFGAAREIGGANQRLTPEAVAGVDFKHQLSERQKLTAAAEAFPDLADLGEFRMVAKGAWEILVNPEFHLNLKLGVEDRFDSTPDGAKKNDLDYFVTLLWKF